MTLKYARMENLISPLSVNPIIDEIVQMQLEAQREMLLRYPRILSRGRPLEDDGSASTSFKTYLRGELETYSDKTLELLHGDIQQIGRTWRKLVYTDPSPILSAIWDMSRSTRWKRAYVNDEWPPASRLAQPGVIEAGAFRLVLRLFNSDGTPTRLNR